MQRVRLIQASVLALSGLLMFAIWLHAGQVVVDRVRITEENDCAIVNVDFNFPVRYVKHFPYETGEDLRIQLAPIITNPADRADIFAREQVRIPPNERAELQHVIYEGNIEGGPYLTLFFRRPVAFKVGQGQDYRGLAVAVTGLDSKSECSPDQE